jgi:hypothetical protein
MDGLALYGLMVISVAKSHRLVLGNTIKLFIPLWLNFFMVIHVI